jgi:hypothetical protein
MKGKGRAIVLSSTAFVVLLHGGPGEAVGSYPTPAGESHAAESLQEDSVKVILRTDHRSPDSLSISVDIQSPVS